MPIYKTPMEAQALQCLGYKKEHGLFKNGKLLSNKNITITVTNKNAIKPTLKHDNSGVVLILQSSTNFHIRKE